VTAILCGGEISTLLWVEELLSLVDWSTTVNWKQRVCETRRSGTKLQYRCPIYCEVLWLADALHQQRCLDRGCVNDMGRLSNCRCVQMVTAINNRARFAATGRDVTGWRWVCVVSVCPGGRSRCSRSAGAALQARCGRSQLAPFNK